MATRFLKSPNGGIYKDSNGKLVAVAYEGSAFDENPNPKFVKTPSGAIFKDSNGKIVKVAKQ